MSHVPDTGAEKRKVLSDSGSTEILTGSADEDSATIGTIIKAAFNPAAATGGVIGSILVTMKMGVARGMYSNEAGLGTAAMVHSPAKVDSPSEQGVWGPIEVFLDTIVVCTITALAIVMSGLWTSGLDGATLTVNAFKTMLPGNIGYWIAIGSVILFGYHQPVLRTDVGAVHVEQLDALRYAERTDFRNLGKQFRS